MTNAINKIAVIGGGAAGMMAAGTALSHGAEVTLFEHTDRLGKKLAITGKGRCNVTNACSLNEFLENVPKNPRFLYAPLSSFSTEDTVRFFESLGVALKEERGRRVFPVSDKAIDIVMAMRTYCSGVQTRFENVTSIKHTDDGFIINADEGRLFDCVIMATGGRSYPLTGSDGSGYRLARKLGHSITPLTPSLVPLESSSPLCARLQGLSLRNVGIKIVKDGTNVLYDDFGEMMFTHFGVTGPIILSASTHIRAEDFDNLELWIDFKPALDEKTLDNRLLSDFSERSNKDFLHALDALLPKKMQEPFLEKCGVPLHKKVNSITKEERACILNLLKKFPISLCGFRPIEEAIITRGGVEVKEVSPKNMESKKIPGLFFAGEMLDIDAYTGGYNLQIAFSTGYLAGKSAAEFSLSERIAK